MGRAIGWTLRTAWRFACAAPWVVAALIAVEGVQHVVEWMTGMYAGIAGAAAAQDDWRRMAVGFVKVVLLELVTYWLARFAASDGSKQAAFARDPRAKRRYAWVIGFSIVLTIITQGLSLMLPGWGLGKGAMITILLALFVGTGLLSVALTPWMVGAAVGDPRATPGFALRKSYGSIWWGFALGLIVTLPPLIAHYVFGAVATLAPSAIGIPVLAADAVLVAPLSLLISAQQVAVARRMAERGSYAIPAPGAAASSGQRATVS